MARSKKNQSLESTVASGDRREILLQLRIKIARALDTCSSGRDFAALSKRLMEVTAEIDTLPETDASKQTPVQRQRERVAKGNGKP